MNMTFHHMDEISARSTGWSIDWDSCSSVTFQAQIQLFSLYSAAKRESIVRATCVTYPKVLFLKKWYRRCITIIRHPGFTAAYLGKQKR